MNKYFNEIKKEWKRRTQAYKCLIIFAFSYAIIATLIVAFIN